MLTARAMELRFAGLPGTGGYAPAFFPAMERRVDDLRCPAPRQASLPVAGQGWGTTDLFEERIYRPECPDVRVIFRRVKAAPIDAAPLIVRQPAPYVQKYPLPVRLMIIGGSNLMLWAGIVAMAKSWF